MTWDPADTDVARANRAVKVETLALLAWDLGLTADDVDALDRKARNRLARWAGVNPPNRGSVTWPLVVEVLRRYAGEAAVEPWGERGWQRLTHRRTDVLDPTRRTVATVDTSNPCS